MRLLSKPKRQHYVPVLHLKHFIGPKPAGQVWTYDALTGEARSSIPENTGLETHFYSAQAADGSMDTSVEDHLSKVESSAAPVYEDLVSGSIPQPGSQARADLAGFLALMHVRTPGMRRMGGEVIGRGLQIVCYAYGQNERAFDGLLRRAEKDGLRPLNAEQKARLRADFLDPSGYVMEVPRERTLMVLGAADRLAPILFEMNWSVIVPAHGFFITSDNPVVHGVDPTTRHPFYGDHSFLNKTVEVVFPLSPQRLLLMSWKKIAAVGGLQREHVDRVNRNLAIQSDRFLYAHIGHKRLSALAAECPHFRPGMTTGGMGPKNFANVEVVRRPRRDRPASPA